MPIIDRYLIKEVTLTLLAVMPVLLLIFLSNRFVQYLAEAAAGTPDDFAVAGAVLIQLLHSGFSDRSGRRQGGGSCAGHATENFIDPFDERVRVTRQRSSV